MFARQHSALISALVLAAGSVLPAAAHAQTNWAGPVNGNWGNALNWTAGLPSGVNPATLGLIGAYIVSVNANTTAGSVTITNPNASVSIDPGATLSTGNLSNSGFVLVNSSAGAPTTRFSPANASTLSGTGLLRLNAPAADLSAARIEASVAFTHAAGHTIAGTGWIYNHTLNNAGLVDADVSARGLLFNSMTVNNTGTLRASQGALQLTNSGVNNTGGLITATGTGAVELYAASVTGGSMSGVGSAAVRAMAGNSPTISATTLSGNIRIENNSNLNIGAADIANNGTITINETAGTATTRLQLSGGGGVLGTGTIRLNANATDFFSARIEGPAAARTFGPGQTIRGAGLFYNFVPTIQGLVEADSTAGPGAIRFDFCNAVNQGQFRAAAGQLQFFNSSINNTAGQISSVGPGAVQLSSVTITGGSLFSTGAGVVRSMSGQSPTISGVTLAGTIAIENNSNLIVGTTSITNNATILVNETAGTATTRLQLSGGGGVIGTGSIRLNATAADLYSARVEAPAAARTIGPGQTIRGTGVIYNFNPALQGVVNADTAGRALRVDFCTVANTGTLTASAGVLQFFNSTVNNTGAGNISATGTGAVELYSVTINGGQVSTIGSGVVRAVSGQSPTLSGTTLNGLFTIQNNANPIIGSVDVINNGTIIVNDTAGPNVTRLQMNGVGALLGTGTVLLNAGADLSSARIEGPGAVARTFGPGQTIRGTGTIYNFNPTIQGTVNADQPGKILRIDFCALANAGTLTATGGGILQLTNSNITQTGAGTIVSANGGLVDFSSGGLTGGTVSTSGTGVLQVSGGGYNMTGVDIAGRLNIRSGGGLNVNASPINGTVVVNSDASASIARFNPTITLTDGSGVLLLNASAANIDTARIEPAGGSSRTFGTALTIAGRGNIFNFRPTIQGTLSPGNGSSNYNDISFNFCTATLAPTATLDIELGGQAPGSFDRVLLGSSSLDLGGTLRVSFGGSYTGQSGASFTIISGGPINGNFNTLDLPPLGPGRNWVVTRTANSLTLLIPCAYADITGIGGPPSGPDGQFTVDDIIAFVNTFGDGTGCPGAAPCSVADITGIGGPPNDPDGQLTVDDIIAFVNAFGDGCN